MKISYGRLRASAPAMTKLASEPLPGRIVMQVARLNRQVQDHVRLIEEQAVNLLQQVGATPDEDQPGTWNFPSDKIAAEFSAKFAEMAAEEVEIDGAQIPEQALLDTRGLTALDIQALDWAIESAPQQDAA